MSIAVSAAPAPSRILSCLILLMSVLALVAAQLLFTHPPVSIDSHSPSDLIYLAFGLVPLASAVLLSRSALSPYKSFQLDISGLGEMRLGEHGKSVASDEGASPRRKSCPDDAVHMLGASTILPFLLILHLRRAVDGKTVIVIILPDSLDPDTFRALLVALGWIANRDLAADVAEVETRAE